MGPRRRISRRHTCAPLVVEALFRELKSQYELGGFRTETEHIVCIQETAALLLAVSRVILRLLADHTLELGDDCVFFNNPCVITFHPSISDSSPKSPFHSATTNRTVRTRGTGSRYNYPHHDRSA